MFQEEKEGLVAGTLLVGGERRKLLSRLTKKTEDTLSICRMKDGISYDLTDVNRMKQTTLVS